MNSVIQLMQQHRSIRRFKPDQIPPDQVDLILRSAQSASTSSNVQAYSIIGVTDPAMKKELAILVGNQPYVEQCPLFLVWCADLLRLRHSCEREQVEMVHGTMENFIVATVDVALAAQNAAIAAESLGLGIVYIGGIRNHPREVSRLLQIPELVYPVFGMCLGYPDQDPDRRPRLPLEAVYHQNVYSTQRFDQAIEEYNTVMREYYRHRTGGKRDTTWSQEMSEKFRQATRQHMRSFLEEQGYGFE
ncbi:oxygen-insensitive NADPH nitroreductase [Brevibacillus humidisoli]|uniref:oxygen-insensitive NADPH nitroreductase n=1 Tax=Brevibacillus humidisoli TaxID=2895522 RepID=UPI001E5C93EC|nr:oxygen-insensitive NADPH nitroreductase [Brevibacillus humidisoli]UFJ42615.1 oxygen-insensitive NADPH nitroreductase [Brevibacillus humidisoli]